MSVTAGENSDIGKYFAGTKTVQCYIKTLKGIFHLYYGVQTAEKVYLLHHDEAEFRIEYIFIASSYDGKE